MVRKNTFLLFYTNNRNAFSPEKMVYSTPMNVSKTDNSNHLFINNKYKTFLWYTRNNAIVYLIILFTVSIFIIILLLLLYVILFIMY